jgi:hypothetical protein
MLKKCITKTDDPFEKLHCQWILKSNIVFILGVLISLLLFSGSFGEFFVRQYPRVHRGFNGLRNHCLHLLLVLLPNGPWNHGTFRFIHAAKR